MDESSQEKTAGAPLSDARECWGVIMEKNKLAVSGRAIKDRFIVRFWLCGR